MKVRKMKEREHVQNSLRMELALLLCCVCLVPRRVVADSRVTGAIWDPASLPASFASTLNVPMVHCAILLIAPSRVFRFQTLETPRNKAGLASYNDGNQMCSATF